MAFSVILYTMIKKENSTAQPATAGRDLSCRVRTNTSIINPTIELDLGLSEAPYNYNYAYIPSFNRYYNIKEWTFEARLWVAQLVVDVLATYKTPIGQADLYVLRASAENDGRVIDNLYPTKVNCSKDHSTVLNPWQSLTNGVYILGIVSTEAGYGSIRYYMLTQQQLGTLVEKMLDTTVTTDNGFSVDDAQLALQLSIIDPLQYIKSAVFIPLSSGEFTAQEAPSFTLLTVFKWSILCPNRMLLDPIWQDTFNFTIIKHPQAQSRGVYLNAAPYTGASLFFPPFGTIEIDTSAITELTELTVTVRLDCFTGKGTLKVYAGTQLIDRIESQVGVPVQISQIARDYMSAPILSGIGAAAGIAGDKFGGIVANGGVGTQVINAITGGMIEKKASQIGNAISALGVRVNSVGSSGSWAQLYEAPRLDFHFFEVVDDDNAHNGRPLCKIRKPSVLGGYMLIQDGDVAISGTQDEAQAVRQYLEGGFYYE